MSHKRAFEALDRTLRDIRESDQIMGGLPVILAGDFRQTLHPQRHENRDFPSCHTAFPMDNSMLHALE